MSPDALVHHRGIHLHMRWVEIPQPGEYVLLSPIQVHGEWRRDDVGM